MFPSAGRLQYYRSQAYNIDNMRSNNVALFTKLIAIATFTLFLAITSESYRPEWYNLLNKADGHGVFTILRFICFTCFAVLAYKDFSRNDKTLSIFWGASALLINPIIQVKLGKEIWHICDWIWIAVLVSTIVMEWAVKSFAKTTAISKQRLVTWNKAWSLATKRVIGGFLVLIVIAITVQLWLSSNRTIDQADTPTSDSAAMVAPMPIEQIPKRNNNFVLVPCPIMVVSKSTFDGRYGFSHYLRLSLRNNGNRIVDAVKIKWTLLDNFGNAVDLDSRGGIVQRDLLPNKTATFNWSINTDKAKKIQVKIAEIHFKDGKTLKIKDDNSPYDFGVRYESPAKRID